MIMAEASTNSDAPKCDHSGDDSKESLQEVGIVEYLKSRELHLPTIKQWSPQLSHRKDLVEFIISATNKLDLSSSCLHLAVMLLDFFMDEHDIEVPKLRLICLVSILIASKIEETESKVPRFIQLNSLADNEYKIQDFPVLESLMLVYFKWQVVLPTAHHFMDTWLPHAMVSYSCCESRTASQRKPDEDVADSNSNNIGSCKSGANTSVDKVDETRFQEHVKSIMKIALKDQCLIGFRPSKISALVLATTRQILELTPTWPQHLAKLTGYAYEELSCYVEFLVIDYEIFESTDKYEGFISLIASPT